MTLPNFVLYLRNGAEDRYPLPFAPTRNFPYYQKLGSENHTENQGVMDESLRSHLGNLCKWISNGLMENKEGMTPLTELISPSMKRIGH